MTLQINITDVKCEPNTKMKFYCSCCGKAMPVIIHECSKDNLNGENIWSDITCCECHFVIATITAPEEGQYDFVKIN